MISNNLKEILLMKTYITLLTASLFAANSYGADCKMDQAVEDFKNRCTGIHQSDASPETKKAALMRELDVMRGIYGERAAIMRQLFLIATKPAPGDIAPVPFPQLH